MFRSKTTLLRFFQSNILAEQYFYRLSVQGDMLEQKSVRSRQKVFALGNLINHFFVILIF